MDCILFSSDEILSIQSYRHWDGIIEYSYDNRNWKEWNGDTISNNVIYMRGVNNTIISDYVPWKIIGNNVKCQGNIENLLDYKAVINNVHPQMATACFTNMFYDCKALIEGPQLLFTELTDSCYLRMFFNCSSLKQIPKLCKVQTIAEYCYAWMFCGCTSLEQSPLTSVAQIQDCSYLQMFRECPLLTDTVCFADFSIAHEAVINQHMYMHCPIQTININNKLYDINVLKLF